MLMLSGILFIYRYFFLYEEMIWVELNSYDVSSFNHLQRKDANFPSIQIMDQPALRCQGRYPGYPVFYASKKTGFLIVEYLKYISGWWFQPLWKIVVNWDDYSQYMEK